MQCSNVYLPDPEGPGIKIFSPRLTERFLSHRVGSDCALYLNVKFLKGGRSVSLKKSEARAKLKKYNAGSALKNRPLTES
jgi:hypothetical protein